MNLTEGVKAIRKDEQNIGTNKYQGLAFFWAYDYRHYLRHLDSKVLKKIHDDFLIQELKLYGVSRAHQDIIDHHTGVKTNLGGKVILMDLNGLENVIEDEIIKQLA